MLIPGRAHIVGPGSNYHYPDSVKSFTTGVFVTNTEPNVAIDLGKYELGWSDEEDYVFKPKRGLNEDIIREMSFMKKEPEWMLDFRLRSYKIFQSKPMPNWGG